MKKVAVVLMNMGGPSDLCSVRKFLFNLFNDKAILSLPCFLRFCAAHCISFFREKKAKEMYSLIGGRSPIFENTKAQAEALSAVLKEQTGVEYKVVIAMRYSYPFTEDAVSEVAKFNPDEIILLPLYPQFSFATTGSSLKKWKEVFIKKDVPIKEIMSFEDNNGFVYAVCELIKADYEKAAGFGKPRILFSAHGLPQRLIDKGDVYVDHCNKTVDAVVKKLGIEELDYIVCYQSRVGFLKWTKPYTCCEIERAGKDGVPVILVPISFVSENLETLVEMDIEYNKLANDVGVPFFIRVQTVSENRDFIEGIKKAIVC